MNQFVEAEQIDSLVGRHVYSLMAEDGFSLEHGLTICGKWIEFPSWLSVRDGEEVVVATRVCGELLQATTQRPTKQIQCGAIGFEWFRKNIVGALEMMILYRGLGKFENDKDVSFSDNGDGTGQLVVDIGVAT